jgi:hypothetical protein
MEIYLKLYKNKNFWFLIPLRFLVDEVSYRQIENSSFSLKPISIDKLNFLKSEEAESLKLIYEFCASTNKFGLFNDIIALQIIKNEKL